MEASSARKLVNLIEEENRVVDLDFPQSLYTAHDRMEDSAKVTFDASLSKGRRTKLQADCRHRYV